MQIRYSRILYAIFASLIPISLAANVIFPSVIVTVTAYAIFSWFLVFIGFIIEWACLYYMVRNFVQTLFVTFLMNLVSTVVGAIIMISANIIFYDITGKLDRVALTINRIFSMGPISGADTIYSVLFFIAMVSMNVILEYPVPAYFFPYLEKPKLFGIIVLANILSVGIVLFGVALYRVIA